MSENDLQKLKEEYPQLFKITSPEIIKFISSEKISSQIADICKKNGVDNEEKIEEIAYRIAWIILGKLPKNNLSSVLKEGVGIDEQTAKKISFEVDRSILSQQLPMEIRKPAITETAPSPQEEPVKIKEELPEEELPPRPSSNKDTYREKIE